MGVGLAALVSGCSLTEAEQTSPARLTPVGVPPTVRTAIPGTPTTEPTSTTTRAPTTTEPSVPAVPPPHPGAAQVVSGGPAAKNQIAITIDDGFCATCSAAYVQFAEQSGIHITFSPNGTYGSVWTPLAAQLRPLIAAGQVQIGNHTFN
ncbi:MAG: polysaccharide deacetylase family protein, partial [Acidimicrobiales bacterium]